MKIPRIVLFLSFVCLCSFADIRIDGSRAVVVYPDKSFESLAKDFKHHLDLMTGADVPLVAPNAIPNDAYVLYIGKAPDGMAEEMQPEEARWQVFDNAAYFYGRKKVGASHAVYDFLENELGFRWPLPDVISCVQQNPIVVKNTSRQWIPKLRSRGIRCNNPVDRLWRARLRSGSHNMPKYGHAFTKYWDRFCKTHQEYFAMRKDGLRLPMTYGKSIDDPAAFKGRPASAVAMCVSSEALVKQVVADWQAAGCPASINLCENDASGRDSCNCPACRELDAPGLKNPCDNDNPICYADRYVIFANRVLEAARKIRPDVKACMYAYNATQEPPRYAKVDKDIILGIVPVDFSPSALKEFVMGWKAAGMNEFFYRPNRHFYYDMPCLPMGSEKYFYEINQLLQEQNAIGFDYDAMSADNVYKAFQDYMVTKSMTDGIKPFEYWENQYMEAFGPAADDVKAYFRYWREALWEARIKPDLGRLIIKGRFNNVARGLTWMMSDYYRADDFAKSGAFLENAATRGAKGLQAKALDRLRLEHRHAELFFKAATGKKDEDAIVLMNFREANGYPETVRQEKTWGDVAGVDRARAFKDYRPPYIGTPVIWKFRLDPEDIGLKERWFADDVKALNRWEHRMCTNTGWERPHEHYTTISKEIRELTADYNGIGWYAITIKVPADWKDREIYLYFGAVDESAWVYVNGKEAGTHLYKNPDDWNTPFVIQINHCIDWNAKEQTVVVRVEDRSGQGGIWKPVSLISK